MRIILFALVFSQLLGAWAQTTQAEYLEAKRQYSLGNYEAASLGFQPLTADPAFGAYASFHYALSSLRLGDVDKAEDMWKQIQVKYPNWEQQQEVDYWLTYLAFEKKNYYKAFRLVEKLPSDWKAFLVDEQLSKLSTEGLDSAYTLNQDNSYLGKYLFDALLEAPSEDRDQYRLQELAAKFGFALKYEATLPLVKKDTYSIAAVLPFMYENLEEPQSVIRNSIIFDLYQGMLLAQDQLAQEGKHVELFPYDTKKRQSEAMKMVRTAQLKHADVIVGPLYGGPTETISQYSEENRVPMVNPLSSSGDAIEGNPFAFLINPSYETQGRKAASFAASKFQKNKKVFIFYESDRDSLMANAYRESIQRDSFFVIRFERLTNEDAQKIQQEFTEQFEVRLDTMYSKSALDSIAKLPGRTVRTRSLRNEKTGRIMKDGNGDDVIETYEVKFYVEPDSIGHIFAATSSNVLANNLISLAEVRSDSIGIIGLEDWLSFSLVSYDQLERLEVDFVSPEYFNLDTVRYEKVKEEIISRTGQLPNKYHRQGFELVYHLGNMFHEYGKHFQRGWKAGEYFPGYLSEGFQYGIFNDNQVVPVTTLKDLQLENQNSNFVVGEGDEDTNE